MSYISAPTAASQKLEEPPLTYLNKGIHFVNPYFLH